MAKSNHSSKMGVNLGRKLAPGFDEIDELSESAENEREFMCMILFLE